MSKLAYTIAEAASATGYTEAQIREKVRDGKIVPRVDNDRLIITASELQRYLASLPTPAQLSKIAAADPEALARDAAARHARGKEIAMKAKFGGRTEENFLRGRAIAEAIKGKRKS